MVHRPPTSPKPVTNLKSLSLNTSTVNEVQSHGITPGSQSIPRVFIKKQKVSPIIDAEYIFQQVVLTSEYINAGGIGISAPRTTSVDSKKATGFLPAWDKVE